MDLSQPSAGSGDLNGILSSPSALGIAKLTCFSRKTCGNRISEPESRPTKSESKAITALLMGPLPSNSNSVTVGWNCRTLEGFFGKAGPRKIPKIHVQHNNDSVDVTSRNQHDCKPRLGSKLVVL